MESTELAVEPFIEALPTNQTLVCTNTESGRRYADLILNCLPPESMDNASRVRDDKVFQLLQRYDLAIYLNTGDPSSNTDPVPSVSPAQQKIAYLRNAITERIWVLQALNHDAPIADSTFFGLGFVSNGQVTLEGETFLSYFYSLEAYNHKRDWNNSRFWANPENFHKYRW